MAVCVARVAAYPTGFELDLVTMGPDDDVLDPFGFESHHRMHRQGTREIPPELLRFGVQFADGAKATNFGGFHQHDREPPNPVMQEESGGGGGGNWRQTW